MSDYPGGAWLTRYRERVNGDAELKVIGDWFTTTFALTFGDSRYAVKVEKGQITDIVTPKLDTRTPFGKGRVSRKRMRRAQKISPKHNTAKAMQTIAYSNMDRRPVS